MIELDSLKSNFNNIKSEQMFNLPKIGVFIEFYLEISFFSKIIFIPIAIFSFMNWQKVWSF